MASVAAWFVGAFRHPAFRLGVVGLGCFVLGHFVLPRRISVVQTVTVKEQVTSNAKVETKECTSRESISYVYVPVKSPQAGCPDVVVPSPVVTGTTSGGGSVAEAGGTAAVDTHVDTSTPASSVSGAGRADWRLSAFLGVGPGGLGTGGVIERRLFGPVSAGAFVFVPLHDREILHPDGTKTKETAISNVSAGATLGVAW